MEAITTQRVEELRQWLVENNLDAILIPHEDEYLGEYIPAHNERLHWLTGFTGSAGAAVVTQDKAAIFVDGRYVVQVTKQVPSPLFEYRHLIEEPALGWLEQNLAPNASVAIDPRLHSTAWLAKAKESTGGKLSLVSLEKNPIDTLWRDRPEPLLSSARLMGLEYVGQSSSDKRENVAKELQAKGIDAALLTQLDTICWLLNIRGEDVSRLPVLLSHIVINRQGDVDFYIDADRLPSEFSAHVGTGVSVKSPAELQSGLTSLAGNKVLVDSANSNAWLSQILVDAGSTIIEGADPCLLAKAAKNPTEIAGMKACHIRDGVAVSRFLAWLDSEVAAGNLHDEAVLADKLEAFRRLDETIVDLSFDTISAAAGNAAMCHYNHENQPEPSRLEMDSVYLVDSGGQYPDGTTDITRTIAIGTPSDELKQQVTLVLKGHISLASARFPQGTVGSQLDVLARQHLWARGYDYDHGTGHGVGHFLSVHEGPQRISKVYNSTALLAGMVVSNEPGYYRADEFGIRIENLEQVVAIETNGDNSMLGFESLTRAPIDKRLINVDMLNRPELTWLNHYHQMVWDDLSPLISGDELKWLEQATAAISY
ncbi:aminopeptidase P family protein [Vibrio sp. SS-MA-C1-2]|uniref:aminopeptidase P family protein n=1 Tax=Vibrio sp. SS-MA-C1-2 TaxID=2908646 RepID=UPI001F36F260|nr:aminopeptidase P family protein [Vibrio sp. SS-MA-C1-2]UJF19367.1 aminopeptidase P family protein [Vibrio sp. SS-MA-C1-2]